MKICPKCGKVLSYNSYFGGYICTDCRWKDVSIGEKRNKGISNYSILHTKKRLDSTEHKVLAEKKFSLS